MAWTSYEMPTKLEAVTSEYAVVSPDKLSVKSTGVDFDCFSVQANRPVPVNMGSDYYYFEMRVKKAGSETKAAIGYSEQGFNLSKYLGYNAMSIGYHGDDAMIYDGSNNSTSCPDFTTNDIVGAGINYASKQIFFTKNGELVGTVINKLNGPLFPTVSIFGSDEEVKVNFGHKPFVYDIEISRYPCPYWHQPLINNDALSSITKGDGGSGGSMINDESSTKDECWKTLMKLCKSSLRKSIEEKENEVASLKIVMEDLDKHL